MPGDEQQFGEVFRPAVGRGGERAVQPPLDHVLGADVVMVGHNEVRQQALRRVRHDRRRLSLQGDELANDPVRSQRSEQVELPVLRRGRAAVG